MREHTRTAERTKERHNAQCSLPNDLKGKSWTWLSALGSRLWASGSSQPKAESLEPSAKSAEP
jgi:hypothetical protein